VEFDPNRASDGSENSNDEDLDPSLLKAAVEKMEEDENSSNPEEVKSSFLPSLSRQRNWSTKASPSRKGLAIKESKLQLSGRKNIGSWWNTR
jgi:hypothetical protein